MNSRLLPSVLPVLDIQQGEVVRGVAGQRQLYRPLVSPVVGTSHAREVAEALRDLVGHSWLYVADLDAIQQRQPQWSLIESLTATEFRLLVDVGLRDVSEGQALRDRGVEVVIAALETVPDPRTLEDLVIAIGSQRTFFSLDLLHGKPLGDWGAEIPISIGRSAIAAGVGGMIVLDLAGVGVGEGVRTETICQQLRASDWEGQIVTGGGVRNLSDVQKLLKTGVDSVLVASALHNGAIGKAELALLG